MEFSTWCFLGGVGFFFSYRSKQFSRPIKESLPRKMARQDVTEPVASRPTSAPKTQPGTPRLPALRRRVPAVSWGAGLGPGNSGPVKHPPRPRLAAGALSNRQSPPPRACVPGPAASGPGGRFPRETQRPPPRPPRLQVPFHLLRRFYCCQASTFTTIRFLTAHFSPQIMPET